LKEFVKKYNHMNIIAVNVPHRYDLQAPSCVNHEVKLFNRKLAKYEQLLGNLLVIKVDTNRDLYTGHGLHLNSKSKELITSKVVAGIKDILHANRKHQKEKGIKVMNQVNVVEQRAISSVRN
jgi:hypothetical protein